MSKVQMNAEDLFQVIKEMENGERWKFLEMMYDEYYKKEWEHEEKSSDKDVLTLKDGLFLAGKIGVLEMMLNRLQKEK
ncbi:hypothetical protein SAMN05428981_12121 [Bacillus sp. OV194]|nr:hypothetical protein SAMN05428981_12121 [Bacillus sp. OV194]